MAQERKKTILVVGGAGFVGSGLCDYFLARGNVVIALDNLSTGSKKNVARLLGRPNFKFVAGDATKLPLAPSLEKRGKIDEIYHLASPASPVHYQKHPVATWQANTVGTLNLLELARRQKAKFLFASTSEVYGDPREHPQKESYRGNVNPVGPRACYDESKRAGESLCMDYRRLHRLDIKIARIFNTYGPRMAINDGRAVSNFIVQALRNKPLTVYGRGAQTRSFQYVDDLIIGLVRLMSANVTGPVNLGNPQEFTILDLAKEVIKLVHSSSRLVFRPLPEDDPTRRKPNIALARKVLRWRPKVNLRQGLIRTIDYFSREVK